MRALLACLIGGALISGLAACGSSNQPNKKSTSPAAVIGKRTKFHNCQASIPLPDSACTPGAIISGATKSDICKPGYSRRVRNVPSSTKRRVYLEYGIRSHRPFQYEVDHLVSLELGGSNSIANLWPEPASPRPGFHEKDKVENYLHDRVCSGKMSLSEAQRKIAHDWMTVYRSLP